MKVRQPELDFTGLDPMWATRPGLVHFVNAVGVVPAQVEPFLIKVLRRAKDELDPLTDAALLADVDVFIRQEAQHYRFHQQMNRWVRDGGFDHLDRFQSALSADYDRMLQTRSLPRLLAYCEGFEAMGLMTARLWVDGAMARLLPGADPRVISLWRWHMAEEYEHRSVVFDVLRRLVPDPMRFYLLRLLGLIDAGRHLGLTVGRVYRYLSRSAVRREGRIFVRFDCLPALVDLLWRLTAVLSPTYVPADVAAPHQLTEALAAFG